MDDQAVQALSFHVGVVSSDLGHVINRAHDLQKELRKVERIIARYYKDPYERPLCQWIIGNCECRLPSSVRITNVITGDESWLCRPHFGAAVNECTEDFLHDPVRVKEDEDEGVDKEDMG